MCVIGRSAALFSETYGGPVLRKLTTGAKQFFYNPPAGFSDVPIVIKRPVLMYGSRAQEKHLEDFYNDNIKLVPNLYKVNGEQIQKMCPFVKV
jgi:D-arginine dehydrogenase